MIRYVCHGGRQVSCGHSKKRAGEHDEKNVRCACKQQKANGPDDLARQKNPLPAEMIGKLTKDGGGRKLAEGFSRDDDAEDQRRASHFSNIEGQHGQDSRHARGIYADDQEDRQYQPPVKHLRPAGHILRQGSGRHLTPLRYS